MCNLHQEGYIIFRTTKCYVSAHLRYLLTIFVLIRNILIAFTTSCVSIFDISNDILYTKTFNLPLNAKKHPPLSLKKRRVLYMVKNNSLGRKGRKYQLYFVIGSFISSPLRVITYSLSILFMQA